MYPKNKYAMKQITYLFVTVILSITQYANATILDNPKVTTPQENIKAPQVSTFNELINPIFEITKIDHLLTRRKGDIKYSDLKVYWKKFIENLDKKRRNPDQVMLDKRNLIS